MAILCTNIVDSCVSYILELYDKVYSPQRQNKYTSASEDFCLTGAI